MWCGPLLGGKMSGQQLYDIYSTLLLSFMLRVSSLIRIQPASNQWTPSCSNISLVDTRKLALMKIIYNSLLKGPLILLEKKHSIEFVVDPVQSKENRVEFCIFFWFCWLTLFDWRTWKKWKWLSTPRAVVVLTTYCRLTIFDALEYIRWTVFHSQKRYLKKGLFILSTFI